VDVRDVAAAVLTTAEHDHQIYAPAGPAARTFTEMAHQLSTSI